MKIAPTPCIQAKKGFALRFGVINSIFDGCLLFSAFT